MTSDQFQNKASNGRDSKTTLAKGFGNWHAPSHWLAISTLDCHTGGEPLRIVTGGFPKLSGTSILAMRRDCLENYDYLRTALMFEPRGHADMYGALITPAERSDSHFGALFMHNEGYSTMCGHAIIALTKTAIEAGVVAITMPKTAIKIDVPCGQIHAYAELNKDGIQHIYFDNVPSFVAALDQQVEVEGIGVITYSLAYGGAFYAYVDASSIGLSLEANNHRQIIDFGRRIKQAVMASIEVVHPFESDLSFLYGTIFSAPSGTPGVHSRNVCIFAEGELDRSPTGSGVSGQAAILHARGQIEIGQTLTIESILGSQFQVSVQSTLEYGDHKAVIPRVQGSAHVTGKNTFYIDPADPLQHGFLFR
nr:proline racemase family protein [uncultured Undibacterium sp.]